MFYGSCYKDLLTFGGENVFFEPVLYYESFLMVIGLTVLFFVFGTVIHLNTLKKAEKDYEIKQKLKRLLRNKKIQNIEA